LVGQFSQGFGVGEQGGLDCLNFPKIGQLVIPGTGKKLGFGQGKEFLGTNLIYPQDSRPF